MKHIPHHYRAHGGDIEGFRFKIKGSHMGICTICKRATPMPKPAWFRRTRPLCSGCGGLLEPSCPAQKEDPSLTCKRVEQPVRRCQICKAKLSMSNPDNICRPCKAKVTGSH